MAGDAFLGGRTVISARSLALMACLVALAAAPAAASASLRSQFGAQPMVAGIEHCPLEVSGQEGRLRSETALVLSSIGKGSEAADDGKITSWAFTGGKSGEAEVSLALFEPNFATSPTLAKELPSKAGNLLADQEHTIEPTSIPVNAGQGIGVTVSSAAGEGNGATVTCFDSSSSDQATLGLWTNALTPSEIVAPTEEGPGQLWFSAHVEYDAPSITHVSSTTGPAAGGQQITIEGQHLAHVGEVVFPEPGTIVSNTNTSITVTVPEAVKSGPVEAALLTAGGAAHFTYSYVGSPRSRTPAIVLEAPSEVTSTSARLNATVDVIGLKANTCNFEILGPGVEEEEEEEEEGIEAEAICEPFPTAFAEGPQHVVAHLTGLHPESIYEYNLVVATAFGNRQGKAEKSASLKTAGSSGGGGAPNGGGTTATTTSTSPAPITITTPVSPAPRSEPIVSVIAHGAISASKSGTVPIKVSCPGGESNCLGTIVLKTLAAVGSRDASAAKKALLTLGSAKFSVTGGHTTTVSVHLSAKARALLKRLHTVRVRATIVAHDSTGATHTTTATLQIRAPRR